jgi:hypothetical protein
VARHEHELREPTDQGGVDDWIHKEGLLQEL